MTIIATTAFEISDDSGVVQLTPAGRFRAIDGRPRPPLRYWYIDVTIASDIIKTLSKRKNPIVIDYNHASLVPGHSAPAAGWMPPDGFFWEDGLRARVNWTKNAQQSIENQEHKFISPVFICDEKTGNIKELINAALTNTPALDGMAEVTLNQFFTNYLKDEANMTSETEPETDGQLTHLQQDGQLKHLQQMRDDIMKMLGIDDDEKIIDTLKARTKGNEMSPAQLAVFSAQRAEIESLRSSKYDLECKVTQMSMEQLINQQQFLGFLPIDEDDPVLIYARSCQTIEALNDFLKTRPVNRPPDFSQSGGKSPIFDNSSKTTLPFGYTFSRSSEIEDARIKDYMKKYNITSYKDAALAISRGGI